MAARPLVDELARSLALRSSPRSRSLGGEEIKKEREKKRGQGSEKKNGSGGWEQSGGRKEKELSFEKSAPALSPRQVREIYCRAYIYEEREL